MYDSIVKGGERSRSSGEEKGGGGVGGAVRFEIQRNNDNGMFFDDEASLYFINWVFMFIVGS